MLSNPPSRRRSDPPPRSLAAPSNRKKDEAPPVLRHPSRPSPPAATAPPDASHKRSLPPPLPRKQRNRSRSNRPERTPRRLAHRRRRARPRCPAGEAQPVEHVRRKPHDPGRQDLRLPSRGRRCKPFELCHHGGERLVSLAPVVGLDPLPLEQKPDELRPRHRLDLAPQSAERVAVDAGEQAPLAPFDGSGTGREPPAEHAALGLQGDERDVDVDRCEPEIGGNDAPRSPVRGSRAARAIVRPGPRRVRTRSEAPRAARPAGRRARRRALLRFRPGAPPRTTAPDRRPGCGSGWRVRSRRGRRGGRSTPNARRLRACVPHRRGPPLAPRSPRRWSRSRAPRAHRALHRGWRRQAMLRRKPGRSRPRRAVRCRRRRPDRVRGASTPPACGAPRAAHRRETRRAGRRGLPPREGRAR